MAAGSSLLYSTEFYASAKKHLKPDGILETWVPKRNIEFAPPIIRSLSDAFSYTRCFDALENGGYHLLASDHPIEIPSVDEFIARTTALAQQDLLEWSASHDLRADVNEVLSHELPVAGLLDPNPRIRITDDQPYNEYFMMRSLLRRQGAVRLSRSY